LKLISVYATTESFYLTQLKYYSYKYYCNSKICIVFYFVFFLKNYNLYTYICTISNTYIYSLIDRRMSFFTWWGRLQEVAHLWHLLIFYMLKPKLSSRDMAAPVIFEMSIVGFSLLSRSVSDARLLARWSVVVSCSLA
jgi:hypothetical protein